MTGMSAPATTVPRPDMPAPGDVTAVVLPTGVPVGGDLFEPGSLRRAIAGRMPKVVVAGDWNRQAGRVLSAVELEPGDPRLPATTPAGQPWPARAGGLLVKMAFIAGTADGRLAHQAASTGTTYAVGFAVKASRMRSGVRMIRAVDLYTISPTVPGQPATLAVKAAPAAGLEIKQTVADWDAERRERARGLPKLTTCSVCGHTAGAILPGGLRPTESLICYRCIAAGRAATSPDGDLDGHLDPTELDDAESITAEEGYAGALADDVRWRVEPDGNLVRDEDAERQGRAWTPDSGSVRRP